MLANTLRNAVRFGVLGGLLLTLLGATFTPAGAPAGQVSLEVRNVAAVVAADDFSISIQPAGRIVTAGASAQYAIALVPASGTTLSPFTLAVKGLPSFTAATLDPLPYGATLTLMTAYTMPAGTYVFVVTATTASVTRSATGSLTVYGSG
ncbi:hypothetical protein Ssi03_56020 [Sphaerisporangium siamense]|uniref:Uncharacterized protein n=1 Tax=Sphaerisporangium siamense TaxID=795645 RepID=A0A7W7DAR2_9ACTN|nr:hypothetical protein [Sphaerisporangium siamense]MBB4703393.1 hypothetical protein [Sphaerisporangium siamense]GII87612.1 hypothetical protein Ssi03_56020 [Sphaerisporangium siamense]